MSSITSQVIANKSDKCLIVFFWAIISLNVGHIGADIAVISSTNRTVDVFVDFELGFAASVPSEGIIGRLVVGVPEDGCSTMESPPRPPNSTDKWFVIVKRYPCQFTTKVQNAMNAGFDAIIIYNIDVSTVKKYSLVHSPQLENGITIPALLISFDDGWTLKKEYVWNKGFYLMILPDLPFNLNAYLLPFAIVIGVCLLLMISFMIVKCLRDRKRRLRHRLSSRHLKQIPVQKFRKGDQYDTCAICLEEYTEGEKLRILPCGHAYHLKCIDPWLTKNRRVCPVCKAKVILPGMSDISDTESESENHNNSGATERTPLLFADRNHNRNRNNRRRRRSHPQSNAAGEQMVNPLSHDSNPETSATQTNDSVSASAPNVRLVEADISPVLAPTHLSINCDSHESVIEVADDASLPTVEPKAGRSRRQDVIV